MDAIILYLKTFSRRKIIMKLTKRFLAINILLGLLLTGCFGESNSGRVWGNRIESSLSLEANKDMHAEDVGPKQ